jgi:hypothetical protein
MKIRTPKRAVLIVCLMSVGLYLTPLESRHWEQLQDSASEYSLKRLPDSVLFGLIGSLVGDGLSGERRHISHQNKSRKKEFIE